MKINHVQHKLFNSCVQIFWKKYNENSQASPQFVCFNVNICIKIHRLFISFSENYRNSLFLIVKTSILANRNQIPILNKKKPTTKFCIHFVHYLKTDSQKCQLSLSKCVQDGQKNRLDGFIKHTHAHAHIDIGQIIKATLLLVTW